MKTAAAKYQFLIWIIIGLIVISIAATPQRTPTQQPIVHSADGNAQKVLASLRSTPDQFESGLATSDAYEIVGAPDEDYDVNGKSYLPNAGSAYIYEQDIEGDWKRVQKIVALDRAANDLFGWTAAVSGDYAVVTAPQEDHDALGRAQARASGSAYIFERDATGNWIEKQKIVASDRRPNDQFGYSVSISGNYLIVGAHQADKDHDTRNRMPDAGAAYIFERDPAGKWNEIQKIVAGDRREEDGFGHSVSIVENIAVVGTRSEVGYDNESYSNAGAAYIFERSASGVWVEQQKINSAKQILLCLEKMF